MHLVIDGYNLLHTVPELAAAEHRGKGRDALAAALRLYREQKGHRITLVFDGGPRGRASLSGVPVVFSGGERSADQVIAEMAARHGPGITVVTADRELAARCQAQGSEVIASWEFAPRLMRAAMDGGPKDLEEDEPGWNFTTRKKGPSRRLPRRLRRRLRRLEEL